MLTYELARRLEGTGVTATILHPGVTRTAFAAEDPEQAARLRLGPKAADEAMSSPAAQHRRSPAGLIDDAVYWRRPTTVRVIARSSWPPK